MLTSLRSSVRLVRRTSVPAAAFAGGYGICWVQGREENAGQLLACTVAGCWVGVANGLRLLGTQLPENLSWPREQLLQVKASELRVLANVVTSCEQRGLDSAPLRRLALRQLCVHAEEDPRGEAVSGLDADGGGLPALAAHLDKAASALAAAGPPGPEQLPLLALALNAVVVAGGPMWQKELTLDGVQHLAHAAMVGSTWLAASLRQRSMQAKLALAESSAADDAAGVPVSLPAKMPALQLAADLSEEDEVVAIENLAAVWEALGQLPAQARVGRRPGRGRSSEAEELHQDMKVRFATLQAEEKLPAPDTLRPLKDALPMPLQRTIAAALEQTGPSKPVGKKGFLKRALELSTLLAVLAGAGMVVKDPVPVIQMLPEEWQDKAMQFLKEAGSVASDLLSGLSGKSRPPVEDSTSIEPSS